MAAVSDFSGLCSCLPFNKLVKVARDEFGMEYLAISNHAFDPAVLNPNYEDARERVLREADEIKRINQESKLGVRLLAGVEANILPGGKLDVDNKTLSELEVVVAARHLFPEGQTVKDIKNDFLDILKNPLITILGHPNRWIEGLNLKDWKEVFTAAANNKTAVEINMRTPLSGKLLKLALRCGVIFSLGSDAHGAGVVFRKNFGSNYKNMQELVERLAQIGISKNKILNTYRLGKLRGWLRSGK